MQYCPKCRHEYRDDVDACPDCEVDLVSELPPETPEEYQDAEWVELYSFPGTLYAKMAVEMLAREHIPAYSQSLFGGGAGFGPTIGGDYPGANATVYVMEPDLARARTVIEPMIDEIPGTVGDDDEEEL